MSNTKAVDEQNIPKALLGYEQWLCWRETERDGKQTKVPITPGRGGFASATDPETWTDFETASTYAQREDVTGLGFVFTADDPFVGVDLDGCREPETGTVETDAQDIIIRLDSYTEVSPSETGFHVLIEGSLPAGRNRRGAIEMYDRARFFTVTGNHLEATPCEIAARQDALVALHREYVAETANAQPTSHSHARSQREPSQADSETDARQDPTTRSAETTPTGSGLDDEELLKNAHAAKNGEKFERLWRGTTTAYDSHSEADMALCCMLAFWSGDTRQMDRLFRRSGLLREKWDDVHYADGSTYGEKTIERAFETTSEFYSAPRQPTESTQTTQQARTAERDAPDAQSTAYLREENRLLKEQVTTQEATIDRQAQRIETLEQQLSAVQASVASPPENLAVSNTTPTDTSLWERVKAALNR